jgi:hypothetical protein
VQCRSIRQDYLNSLMRVIKIFRNNTTLSECDPDE